MYLVIDHRGRVRKGSSGNPAWGTSRRGTIEVSYQKLVETFGEPNAVVDRFKSDAAWLVYTPDGVATIYNFKDGKNHLGAQGKPVKDITVWHVGAHTNGPYCWVRGTLGLGEEELA